MYGVCGKRPGPEREPRTEVHLPGPNCHPIAYAPTGPATDLYTVGSVGPIRRVIRGATGPYLPSHGFPGGEIGRVGHPRVHGGW